MRTSVTMAALLLAAASPLAAQEGAPRIPSVRLGNVVDAGLNATVQMDWGWFPGQPAAPSAGFDLRRARLGLEGSLFRRIEYQVERNLHESSSGWADAYANVALPHGVEVRAGRFKVPFSLEQLTASTELDFAYRSLAAAYLAPGREIGAMAHGRVLGSRVKYQAGVFRAGGDNARSSERNAPSAGSTAGGRIVLKPWEKAPASSPLAKLAVGASMTSGRIPQGPNDVRGHTHADVPLFQNLMVNGRRRRIGGELEWRYGPVSIRSERIRVSDERLGEGTDDDDLQNAVANGWYVSGTWLATGEKKTDRIKPSRPVVRGGVGALELAARIEQFRLASTLTDAPASGDPRARTIAGDSDRAATFGIKWYPTRTVTLQINVIREVLVRRGAGPDAASPVWSRVIRIQVAL